MIAHTCIHGTDAGINNDSDYFCCSWLTEIISNNNNNNNDKNHSCNNNDENTSATDHGNKSTNKTRIIQKTMMIISFI